MLLQLTARPLARVSQRKWRCWVLPLDEALADFLPSQEVLGALEQKAVEDFCSARQVEVGAAPVWENDEACLQMNEKLLKAWSLIYRYLREQDLLTEFPYGHKISMLHFTTLNEASHVGGIAWSPETKALYFGDAVFIPWLSEGVPQNSRYLLLNLYLTLKNMSRINLRKIYLTHVQVDSSLARDGDAHRVAHVKFELVYPEQSLGRKIRANRKGALMRFLSGQALEASRSRSTRHSRSRSRNRSKARN